MEAVPTVPAPRQFLRYLCRACGQLFERNVTPGLDVRNLLDDLLTNGYTFAAREDGKSIVARMTVTHACPLPPGSEVGLVPQAAVGVADLLGAFIAAESWDTPK